MKLTSVLKHVVPPGLLLKARSAYLVWDVMHQGGRVPSMDALPHLVSAGDVVFDLGANIGTFALQFSKLVGPTGRVFSVEPIAENYKVLRRVARKLGNVQAIHAAVGSRPYEMQTFVIPQDDSFSGFYTAHVALNGEQGQVEVVGTVTLDGLAEATDSAPHFVKCNVAGSELEVLAGAQNTIRKFHPIYLIGISPQNSLDVFAFMKAMGYRACVWKSDIEVKNDPRKWGTLVEVQGHMPRYYHYFFLPRVSS
jgi:FkbM family methyltransferase